MRHGDWAWLAIVGAVFAYELKSPPGELLSQAVDRYRRRHPILTDVAIVYVAAHLLRRWPPRLDPLHLAATRLGR